MSGESSSELGPGRRVPGAVRADTGHVLYAREDGTLLVQSVFDAASSLISTDLCGDEDRPSPCVPLGVGPYFLGRGRTARSSHRTATLVHAVSGRPPNRRGLSRPHLADRRWMERGPDLSTRRSTIGISVRAHPKSLGNGTTSRLPVREPSRRGHLRPTTWSTGFRAPGHRNVTRTERASTNAIGMPVWSRDGSSL